MGEGVGMDVRGRVIYDVFANDVCGDVEPQRTLFVH